MDEGNPQGNTVGTADTSSALTSEVSEVNELDPTVNVSQNTWPDVLEINVAPRNDVTTL